MKRTAAALLGLMILSASAIAESFPKYLEINVNGENDISNPIANTSLVYEVALEREYSGVYYIAGSSSGIVGMPKDPVRLGQKELEFALVFNLRLSADGQTIRLRGSTYAQNYLSGSRSGRGESMTVEKEITIGQQAQVCSYQLVDGRQVTMHVAALKDCPARTGGCGENAVSLISTLLRQGKQISKVTNARKLLSESLRFQADFVAPSEVPAVSTRVDYQVSILLPGATLSAQNAADCRIVFERAYQIHSISKTEGNKVAVSLTSRNVKEVTLLPGKETRLIFPPDVPSVEGFQIEDTLIIVPR